MNKYTVIMFAAALAACSPAPDPITASPFPSPTASPTPTVTATASPSPSPTPTNTPGPTDTIIEVTPRDSIGYNFTDRETEALAALCVVEVRGMGEARTAAACLSVVSTVLTRIQRGLMTDGTVLGTITYGCRSDTIACHFPAYVVNGCVDIMPSACPYSYPADMIFFRTVIRTGGDYAGCYGYLFYGIQSYDTPECQIMGGAQFLNFHNGNAPDRTIP